MPVPSSPGEGCSPLLARCRMVSICSPDSFAFFMADVARGHPDKLGTRHKMALVTGLGRAPSPAERSQKRGTSPSHFIRLAAGKGLCANGNEP